MIRIITDHIQVPSLLHDVIAGLLSEAMACDDAVKCTFQIYDERVDGLRIIAHSGFSQKFLDHFKLVKSFDGSSCGRAIGIGSPILISDFSKDIAFDSNLALAVEEGISAVASFPMYDPAHEKLGVVSIHYAEPKWTWNLSKMDKVLKELTSVLEEIRQSQYQNH